MRVRVPLFLPEFIRSDYAVERDKILQVTSKDDIRLKSAITLLDNESRRLAFAMQRNLDVGFFWERYNI